MNTTLKTIVTVTCTVLALLLLGASAVIVVKDSASAAPKGIPSDPLPNVPPFFDIQISPLRPQSLESITEADISQKVNLAADEVTLDRYDIYYTNAECTLALHFASTGKNIDLRKIKVGFALRGRESHDIIQTTGGSLWAFLHTQQDNYIHQGPFTLWVVFKSVDLDVIAKLNGEAKASEAANPYVEVYVDSGAGLTYAGTGSKTSNTSPFISITNIQPFRRK